MGRIVRPVLFSEHFAVPTSRLSELGALDPSLNVDTKLFIDPLLLVDSQHQEMNDHAQSRYEHHFGLVIQLLVASEQRGDVPWRNAERLLTFPEVKWTCLGYGGDSISGSGSGAYTRDGVMQTAATIVRMGIENPDLFAALALLEEGIGPDRISDMTTNIILPDLIAYTCRVLDRLDVPRERFDLTLQYGQQVAVHLPVNPFVATPVPVVLVPQDVLRDLPIATDWSDVADAASHNAGLRARVNHQIAEMWQRKSRKDKDAIRGWALRDRASFEVFLDMLRGANPRPYDFAGDPLGELIWHRVVAWVTEEEPLQLAHPATQNLDALTDIVRKIIDQFRFLVEERRLSEELYHRGKPRPEKSAQRLFHAVAYSYCRANDVDVTPEADTGSGVVDFKFSVGMNLKVLVEVKLSRNPALLKGYTKQLQAYKAAEETMRAFYLVIDVGSKEGWEQKLVDAKNDAAVAGNPVSEVEFVDGSRRVSASRLR